METENDLRSSIREAIELHQENIDTDSQEQEEYEVVEEQNNVDDSPTEEEIIQDPEAIEEEQEQNLPFEIKKEEWTDSEKQVLQDLYSNNPEAADLLYNKFKNIHSGFMKKSQINGDLNRQLAKYENVHKIIDQYEDQIAMSGTTADAVINRIIAVDRQLKNDPINAIRQLAKNSNIDLNDLIEDQYSNDYDFSDPQTEALREEINNLKQYKEEQIKASEQAKLQQQQFMRNPQIKLINDFADAKDEEGQLLHPRFDDLIPQIKSLQVAFPEDSLESLYNKAVMLESQDNTNPVKKTVSNKQDAISKARKAGKSVRNGKVNTVNEKNISVRDSITKQLRDAKLI